MKMYCAVLKTCMHIASSYLSLPSPFSFRGHPACGLQPALRATKNSPTQTHKISAPLFATAGDIWLLESALVVSMHCYKSKSIMAIPHSTYLPYTLRFETCPSQSISSVCQFRSTVKLTTDFLCTSPAVTRGVCS